MNKNSTYIGFEGCGNDIELMPIKETEKAYLVQVLDEPTIEMWLPKSAFDDSGSLTDYGINLYQENFRKEIGE